MGTSPAVSSGARRALVTGASSGIGAATVRALVHKGYDVIALARREDRLEGLAQETGCSMAVCDLTSEADVDRVRLHLEQLGSLDVLVNNAGGAIGIDPVATANADDWAAMFDLNVLGTQRMIRALLPLLRQGARAHGVADIVAMSSTAAFLSYEGGGGYNAAKAAVHAMVGALRLELVGEPIRIIEIAPGMVHTEEFALNRFDGDQARADALYEGVESPLVADDIADVIAYALGCPPHVNLDLIQLKPVAQAAQYKLHRGPLKPKG
jgi:NADP-dependent 3-hydroxy acid dehydrogenase YdfG